MARNVLARSGCKVPARRLPNRLAVVAVAVGLLPTLVPVWIDDAHADRIRDLATVRGVRSNQLVGYGLVVGLDGSGDQTTQTPFTTQSLQTMLAQLGIQLPPGQNLQLRNVAAVMVTASLPAYSQPGQGLDVTVSSMGNAKSLRGGTLLMTPLKGADGQTYAIAQGNVVIAGAGASSGGSKAQINQLNSGRIPAGATVERAVPTMLGQGDTVELELNRTDFALAAKVAQAINAQLDGKPATALDGRRIQVRAPQDSHERVALIGRLEAIDVDPPVSAARVILNARTGTVTMNRAVSLEPVAIAHGNLSIAVTQNPQVSQPLPASGGQTVVTPGTDIQIKQDGGALIALSPGARLNDVVKALNTLGATPADLLAILQALKAAGALKAELEVI